MGELDALIERLAVEKRQAQERARQLANLLIAVAMTSAGGDGRELSVDADVLADVEGVELRVVPQADGSVTLTW